MALKYHSIPYFCAYAMAETYPKNDSGFYFSFFDFLRNKSAGYAGQLVKFPGYRFPIRL